MLKIKAPASSANLGPGFDCLGLALNLYNIAELEQSDVFQMEIAGLGSKILSRDINKNLFFKAFFRYFEQVNEQPVPVKVKLINSIPLTRGLGSSAATVAAGLVAARHFSHHKLSEKELFNLGVAFEGHADNIGAALFGGLVLTYPTQAGYQVQKLTINNDIGTVIIVPEQQLKTSQARQVLPKQIPLADAVFNLSRLALLLKALAEADFSLLKTATADRLHEPYRRHLIAHYDKVKEIVAKVGLPALVISGAGSSLLAFCPLSKTADFQKVLQQEFKMANLNLQVKVVSIDKLGTRLEKEGEEKK